MTHSQMTPRAATGCAAAVSALLVALAAHAAPPHEHGVAQLAAVLEGEALTLELSIPLDSLLGFERAPRNAAEQQAAAKAIDTLRRDGAIVRPDPAAQCERTDVTLVSAPLGLGAAPAAGTAADEHADVDATYTFRCRQPARLAQIELPLMAAFPRVARLEAQIVAAKGQRAQTVPRAAPKLAWPR